jgi:hypothetical protein
MGNTYCDFNENVKIQLVSDGVVEHYEKIAVNINITVAALKEKIMRERGLSYLPNLYLVDGRELQNDSTLEGIDNNSTILIHENDVPIPNFPHFDEFSQALEVTNRNLKKQMIQVKALVRGTFVLYSLVNKCKPYFQPYLNMVFSYVQLALKKKRD